MRAFSGVIWDKRSLKTDLAFFGVMMFAMYLTQGSGFALVWLMALAALMSNNHERLLLVMVLTVAALVGNSNLLPKGVAFHVEQKSLIMFLAVALTAKNTSIRRHSPLVKPFLLLMPYLAWMAMISMQGWNPTISYLKIILFLSFFFAFYGIADAVISGRRVPSAKVRSVFLSLCVFAIVGSVALIPFPGISQMGAEDLVEALKSGIQIKSLFKGMMFHSQALGPLMAMLFVAVLSDYVFTARKKDMLYLLLLVCAPIALYKTSSRTAMGTMLAGTMFTLWLFMRTRQIRSVWKARVVSTSMLVIVVGACALASSGSGREAIARYVTKTAEATTLAGVSSEEILSSRQGLMDEAMYNFRRKPFVGNGFQVSEVMSLSGGGGAASLLSAPVEKGVWLTAVLEEGGIPGMIMFVLFGVCAIPMLIVRRAYTGATMLFMMFVLNLGEFTFFSMSGIGGFCWMLCFLGVIMDASRLEGWRQGRMPSSYPRQSVNP